ncbi:MAG: HEPN domain-containing protein [Thermodesulfobacteriota bacterium]
MDEYVKGWITKAKRDLKVAEHELGLPKEDIITDAVCFHCQQAVEKFLKAYLASKNLDFGKTHNLEYLIELCFKNDPEFKSIVLGNLSFYAVEIRYPDEFYTPSLNEAEESFQIAIDVKNFVLKKLGIDKDIS